MKNLNQLLIIIMIAIFMLTGCATSKPLSRAESLAVRNKQIEDTTRVYTGITKEEVLIAVDRLFRLADGDDFKITHAENAIIGERRWLIYLVFAAAFGQDRWVVAAEENPVDKTVKVIVRISSVGSPIVPMVTPSGTGSTSTSAIALPGVESTITGDALYYIFFKRLDYLLRKSDMWLDCAEAADVIKNSGLTGSVECLCNPFNMKDSRPDSVEIPTLDATDTGEKAM